MKATTKPAPALTQRVRGTLAQLWDKPAVRKACTCAGMFAAAFFLAALSIGGAALPLAACTAAAVVFWPNSLLCTLGACLGYWLRFGAQGALEPIAVAILVLAGSGIFHDTRLPAADWFTALLCSGLTAAVGFVFLLDTGLNAASVLLFAAKLLMAALFPLLCRQALEATRTGVYLSVLLLVFTGVASSFPPFGFFAATVLAFAIAVGSAETGLLPTLLCMIALDLSGNFPCPLTAGVCCGALLCRMLPRRTAPFRCASLVITAVSWQLLFGVLSVPFCCCALSGGVAGIFIPVPLLRRSHTEQLAEKPSDGRLRKISKVFALMHRELSDRAPAASRSEISEIYDATAEQVCRCCGRCRVCWQTDAEQTYQALCEAAEPIMRRGTALREDFPTQFSAQCRHMEGFLTALNQELEQALCKRQLRSRLLESRRIVSGQYLQLSRFLGTLAQEQQPDEAAVRFEPDYAAVCKCRAGSAVCGDRCTAFEDKRGMYYVLLCDGMGTGAQAAQESAKAVRIVQGLLESGIAPDAALETLNSFYVLQECSAFSTIDLLCVSLQSGGATLYKWGAPPSYLRSGDAVTKIGTASPPPGLGVGSDHTAQQLKLSLKDEETLVMLSDGASGEETEKRLAGFRGSTSRELAAYLAAGAEQESGDDLTAAVVQLLPVSSESNHNINR